MLPPSLPPASPAGGRGADGRRRLQGALTASMDAVKQGQQLFKAGPAVQRAGQAAGGAQGARAPCAAAPGWAALHAPTAVWRGSCCFGAQPSSFAAAAAPAPFPPNPPMHCTEQREPACSAATAACLSRVHTHSCLQAPSAHHHRHCVTCCSCPLPPVPNAGTSGNDGSTAKSNARAAASPSACRTCRRGTQACRALPDPHRRCEQRCAAAARGLQAAARALSDGALVVVEAAGKTTAGMAAAGKEAGMHKAAAGKRGRTTATSDDASAAGAPPLRGRIYTALVA